jgi:thiol:disulfide interchange protein
VLAGVKAGDLAVVMVALAVSLFAFVLFPSPAAVLALLVGGAGWVEARRGRVVGRRLLGVFAGMVQAAAVIAVLAFAFH